MMYRTIVTSLGALLIAACQLNATAAPAVLSDGSADTMNALKSHLAAAMGVARITLGAGDPTAQSHVSVLPPRLGEHETRSPAAPTQFNLLMIGDVCYAQREDTGEKTKLTGVPCRTL